MCAEDPAGAALHPPRDDFLDAIERETIACVADERRWRHA
jgi:hypothetical protein